MAERGRAHRGMRGGVFSLLAGQWGKYLLQVLSFVVLARLLSPADFGLITMMTAVLGLATVVGDMGLSMAALQREALSQSEKSNLFWLNLLMGLLATLLAAVASPILAGFYGQPELTMIGLAISITFVMGGASVQSKVELNRQARFATLASIDFGAQAIAFLASVGLALGGAGVWALVGQSLIAPLVGGIWAVLAAKWIPSRWARDTPVKPFLTFGASTLALQSVNYISVNIANVVIGRTMMPASVGIYGRATQLISLPVQQLASPLTRIALPYLADQSRISSEKFELAALMTQRILVVVLLGALSLLAALADPLVPLLLGSDWLQAVPLVRILAIGGAFQALGYLYYWLFLSTARTRELLISELPGRLLLLVLVLLTWPLGLEAIAWSFVASQFVIWLTGSLFYVRRTGVRTGPLLSTAAPMVVLYLVSTVAALVVGWVLISEAPVLRVLATGGVWLLLVGLGYWLVPACRAGLAATVTRLRR